MDKEKITRTQVRFPDAIYLAVRHIAAATNVSFNKALISLISQALESHHDQIPKSLLDQLTGQRETD